MKKHNPAPTAGIFLLLLYDLYKMYIPRFMKNTLGKSTKLMVAKIISVGKNAMNINDIRAVFSSSVISFVSLYIKKRFAIEMIKGNRIVAVSFIPNNL